MNYMAVRKMRKYEQTKNWVQQNPILQIKDQEISVTVNLIHYT